MLNVRVGGLIKLSLGRKQNLQYVVNAVFLASLYADYSDALQLPGWYCGSTFIPLDKLREFASSQVQNFSFLYQNFPFLCQLLNLCCACRWITFWAKTQ